MRNIIKKNPLFFAFFFPAIVDAFVTFFGQGTNYLNGSKVVNEASPAYYFLLASPWVFVLGTIVWFVFWYWLFKKMRASFKLFFMFLFISGHSWGSSSWIMKFLRENGTYQLGNQPSIIFSWGLLIIYLMFIAVNDSPEMDLSVGTNIIDKKQKLLEIKIKVETGRFDPPERITDAVELGKDYIIQEYGKNLPEDREALKVAFLRPNEYKEIFARYSKDLSGGIRMSGLDTVVVRFDVDDFDYYIAGVAFHELAHTTDSKELGDFLNETVDVAWEKQFIYKLFSDPEMSEIFNNEIEFRNKKLEELFGKGREGFYNVNFRGDADDQHEIQIDSSNLFWDQKGKMKLNKGILQMQLVDDLAKVVGNIGESDFQTALIRSKFHPELQSQIKARADEKLGEGFYDSLRLVNLNSRTQLFTTIERVQKVSREEKSQ